MSNAKQYDVLLLETRPTCSQESLGTDNSEAMGLKPYVYLGMLYGQFGDQPPMVISVFL